MFQLDQFIDDCQKAYAEDSTHKAVQEVIARAVSDPGQVLQGLGEPTKGGVHKLYHSDTLTILNVVWAPRMTLLPHNHNMWAVIGVYSGREDNIFWRRNKHDADCQIEAAGAKSMAAGEATPLGKDIIHSVTNPTGLFTGALHVYGGDFYDAHRSEWEPECLTERPFDYEGNAKRFEEANAMARLSANGELSRMRQS